MSIGNEIKVAVLLVLVCIAFLAGHHIAHQKDQIVIQKIQLADAQQLAAATQQAREREQLLNQRFAAQAAQYEKDKSDAKSDADRTVANLRAGNLRLRATWRCPAVNHVPRVATRAGEPDAAANDRAASAGRIIRAAADADAQIRGLQALLSVERKP